MSFLDGGYLDAYGYGFGSHSYANIIGENELQLVCHRIGVRPPRGKPGAGAVASQNLVHVILRACGFEESRCDAADLASALRLKVHWRVRSMSGPAPYHA